MEINFIIKAVLYLVLAPLLGGLLSGTDRLIAARMQGRQGPPIIQPFYDVNKLLHKQTTVDYFHFLLHNVGIYAPNNLNYNHLSILFGNKSNDVL